MDEEWDLFAVVRHINMAATTTAATATSVAAAPDEETITIDSILATILNPTIIEEQLIMASELFGTPDKYHDHFTGISESEQRRNNPFDELGELYRPFFRADDDEQQILQRNKQQQHQLLIPQRQQQQQQQQYFAQQPALPSPSPPTSQYRCRKRKRDQKRTTCQVTAENILTSDKWAWRKYGQKPIKASPYPRNYYRCSSIKGCTARKQVERSPTDPNMYVVTYTGDHCHPHPTHRNSLAGSTRTKLFVPLPPPPPPPPDSDYSTTTLSPTTPLMVGPSGGGGDGGEREEDGVYGLNEILVG
ncbi:putative WRKY transcription factor 27 [Drosera capensis]